MSDGVMLKDVVEVRPLEGHKLYVRFEDGIDGEVDVASLVPFEGVFAELRDQEAFRAVSVDPELGTVCWPTGADLAPDVLYAAATGQDLEVRKVPSSTS